MGDRANVKVVDGGQCVYLYTHWGGTDLPETLRRALVRGESRWDDAAYLARIIFSEMTRGSEEELTGYGISPTVPDGGDRILEVDVDDQVVRWPEHHWCTIQDYCHMGGTPGGYRTWEGVGVKL